MTSNAGIVIDVNESAQLPERPTTWILKAPPSRVSSTSLSRRSESSGDSLAICPSFGLLDHGKA